MIHVPHIVCELVAPGNTVAAVDLCPTRDACHDFMTATLFGRIQRQVFQQQGSRTYKAHLAKCDVEKLRQLVEGGFANKGADAGESSFIAEKLTIRTPFVVHGPEFYNAKNSFAIADARLCEKWIPALDHDQQ